MSIAKPTTAAEIRFDSSQLTRRYSRIGGIPASGESEADGPLSAPHFATRAAVEFKVAQIHATLTREANTLLGRETGKGGVRIVLDDEFRKVELL